MVNYRKQFTYTSNNLGCIKYSHPISQENNPDNKRKKALELLTEVQLFLGKATQNQNSLYDILYELAHSQRISTISLSDFGIKFDTNSKDNSKQLRQLSTSNIPADVQLSELAKIVQNRTGITSQIKSKVNVIVQDSNESCTDSHYYIKEYLLTAADNGWDRSRRGMEVQDIVPGKKAIQQKRHQWFQKVQQELSLAPTSSGWQVNPIAVVKLILEDCILQNQIPRFRRILFKLSLDKASNSGLIALDMTPLNTEIFATQTNHALFHLLLFRGEEKRSNIENNIQAVYIALKQLRDNGIVVGGKLFYVDFCWCSDLHSCWEVFNFQTEVNTTIHINHQWCPFCIFSKISEIANVPQSLYYTRQKPLDNIFNIPMKIRICILHLLERMTEHLLERLARNDPQKKNLITNYINNTLHIRFNFKIAGHGEPSTTFLDSFMLKGNDAIKICKNYTGLVFAASGNSREYTNDLQIWKLWNFILHEYIQKPNTIGQSPFNSTECQSHINTFVEAWKNAYGSIHVPYYLHIIEFHLTQLLVDTGSLVPFSTEQNERIHVADKFFLQNKCSHGGKRHTTESERTNSDIYELMCYNYTKVLLQHQFFQIIYNSNTSQTTQSYYLDLLHLNPKQQRKNSIIEQKCTPVFESSLFRFDSELFVNQYSNICYSYCSNVVIPCLKERNLHELEQKLNSHLFALYQTNLFYETQQVVDILDESDSEFLNSDSDTEDLETEDFMEDESFITSEQPLPSVEIFEKRTRERFKISSVPNNILLQINELFE